MYLKYKALGLGKKKKREKNVQNNAWNVSSLSFQSHLQFLPAKIGVQLMFNCSGASYT